MLGNMEMRKGLRKYLTIIGGSFRNLISMGKIIEKQLKKENEELKNRVKEMQYINMGVYKKAYDKGYRKAKKRYSPKP